MKIITGDECGLLKECIPSLAKKVKPSTDVNARPSMPVIVDDGVRKLNSDSEVSREEGIVDLCWTAQDKEFASLLNN